MINRDYEIAINRIAADVVEGILDLLDRGNLDCLRVVKERTAYWIDGKCSECGYENHSLTNANYCPNYCPNCGIRLKTFEKETKFDF